jgi:hypothetical protein
VVGDEGLGRGAARDRVQHRVSTSMKPLVSMKRRIDDIAAVRALKVRRVSS